uniref:Uncharacterized protein n=1 Tax=Candidatus Kentrum sp. MB TaxID=2138164 RepID=A0A451BBZ3_9GAMM|nr:MAG: hypothetical protein BECKMB1821I_GA0114274_103138 [Candidatus Kentron sp. MB]VFK32804.1 MAG: hypothetical protein BECKMB1821G_GA0114241_11262 [Candidatus Kentron sp. MB]VFK75790.1 MAG: hypothetical protein BECKMB1821H_GA0114242_103139 [Candidatus Kentron sp. MB]
MNINDRPENSIVSASAIRRWMRCAYPSYIYIHLPILHPSYNIPPYLSIAQSFILGNYYETADALSLSGVLEATT